MNRNTYHIEIVNLDQSTIPMKKFTNCVPIFVIPVIMIPGIETPFRGLGLKHDWEKSK